MTRTYLPFGARRKNCLWMWLGLELGALMGWLLWWWLNEQPQAEKAKPGSRLILPPGEGIPPVLPRPKKATLPPDELTTIKGIGPKYAQVLNDAGITRYAQLAAHSSATLQEIIRAAGGRTLDVDVWIEQAKSMNS